MSLAICIPTMNRPDDLRTALQSLLDGSTLPDEIIVSDDGGGSAREVAEKFPQVRYQLGPGRGLGANRNACIDVATSSFIAFIDDDVIVSPDFVETAKRVADPFAIVTGYECNHSHFPPSKVTPHNASFLGFQRVPPDRHLRAIVINATVFPTQLFERARFDDQIRYGYEELDMAQHATALGYEIRYSNDLHVEHFPSPVNRDSYRAEIDVSRLYVLHKVYAQYERNPLKAALYDLVAGVHHVAHGVKSGAPLRDVVTTLKRARGKQKQHARGPGG